MKNNLTELIFILDRSGSMAGLESDTVGGFNALLEKQRKEDGRALVSAVLFNQYSRVIYDRVPIEKVRPLTEQDYTVSGSTALYDAIGDAIHHIRNVHKYQRPEDVPEHTVMIITTDGLENASHRYDGARLRHVIEKQQEAGWEFLFLGTNIDVIDSAHRIGIDDDHTAEYLADQKGVRVNYVALDEAIREVRHHGRCSPGWRRRIDEDRRSRGTY